MEIQGPIKPKNNLGVSLLTGCGTSLAVFVVLGIFFLILALWLSGGNESGFAIWLVLGFAGDVILALVALIVVGVIVFRARQPRPFAFGLLSWAGMSIFTNIAIIWLASLAEDFIRYNTLDTDQMYRFVDILHGIEGVMLLVANILAVVLGWLIYRRQRSKINQDNSPAKNQTINQAP